MEEESILARLLGARANAVDQVKFEQTFITRLEENLKEAEAAEQAEEHEDGNDEDAALVNEDGEEGHPQEIVIGENASTCNEKLLSLPVTKKGAPTGKGLIAAKKRALVKTVTEEKVETEQERKIRTGEMTPFGSDILQLSTAETPTRSMGSFLDFDKYLKEQTERQKGRRKFAAKTGKQKDNRFDATKKLKKKNRADDSEVEEGEVSDDDEEVSLETIKKKAKLKVAASLSSKKKSPLDMNVIFPKKRKRKAKLGSGTSEDPRDARRTPGKTVAESTAMYINPSDDSNYIPSDNGTSDDDYQTSTVERPIRQQKKRTKKSPDRFSDDSDWLDSSEDERPLKSRSKKETDDGNYKYYLKRVESWKQSETRLTGKMHSFEGGFKLPSYLWDSLYKYQKIGVKWLWELHQQRVGGILGDEMGLGKTIQVITFLAGVSCSNLLFPFTNYRGLGPSIIVCPATVMHQWVKEFHKWWPPFRVAILHESGSYSGSKTAFIKSIQDSNGILITSYAGVVSNQNEILRYQWHYVILDEGHKIRNPDAQATLTLKQVATPHRFILSGSPLQNNLKELWSLFDFVYPGKLGTLPAFMEQFAVPITLGGYSNASEVQVATAFKCATILRDIINPYLLRRMKADVKTHLNLPEKTEQVLFCKMTDEQRALYINYINSREIESIVQGRFNLFVGLINLRKICNHPHLFDGGPKLIKSTKFAKKIPKSSSGMKDDEEPRLEEDEGSDIELDPTDSFGHWSKSGKMIVVETLLKLWHKQKHKVLLFTQSRQMLCILENFVRQQNYNYVRLDGSTSIGSRQPLIQRFNEDPDLFVFILTTRVGGLGVNLTGANRIIIFDPDWNPSTDSQARERAWRIGQIRQVTIYRLITSGTIEEKMYHRQIFKQFLTNRVLKDPRQKRFFKSNDLLELFSYNEGSGKGTESEAIFAGTGSKIKLKKSKKQKDKGEAREKSSGKFRGVPFLEKQSKNEAVTNEDEEVAKDNDLQDSYVLQKLFSKSGVEAAFRHDSIVNTDEADYMLVEQEAERVAKEAAAALKRSREQCWSADSGNVNWTGSHGAVREPSQLPKPKFGSKRAFTNTTTKPIASATPAVSTNESKLFSGPSLEPEKSDLIKPLSSSDMLAIIRARNRPLTAPSTDDNDNNEGSSSSAFVSQMRTEHQELFRDLRDYIAFQAIVDGQATTTELVSRFKTRLPPEETPLFKKMLGQLCTFRRVEGQGVWRLKPVYR
ncbi:DNA excision repair protein ERCC-6 [Orchesella cincta]|uniref:DNA repair and recombination protein RAD54-like n=1 Tax=Orchesella cincta TaxID=48709 RepID=A0A1D2MMH6_ORCCI|nr:DNA excision repair protein ERCC-6 [Orchesella cincta]